MTLVDKSRSTGSMVVVCACFVAASLHGQTPGTPASEPASLLNQQGSRGGVLFPHRVHESAVPIDAEFPHQPAAGVACLSCHHKVERVTTADQFQACSACHRAEGHPDNPEDKAGIELSGREAAHRACIGCHQGYARSGRRDLFRQASYTKCGECHRSSKLPAEAIISAVTIAKLRSEVGEYSVALPVRHVAPGSTVRAEPALDRWHIAFPDDPRRERPKYRLDPFHQNQLKGDYPVAGRNTFLTLTGETDTQISHRQLTGSLDTGTVGTNLFERGNQMAARENVMLTVELAHNATAFRPASWRVVVAPTLNINHLRAERDGIVNIDPARGHGRTQGDAALQVAFTDVRLGDTPRVLPFLRAGRGTHDDSPYFDSTTLRTGIQTFSSDFRGFIYSDTNLGARVVGNYAANRYQFNLAAFRQLEKNVNSELNTLHSRDQTVLIANLYRQDTWVPGYHLSWSVHYNRDGPSLHVDENGFLSRAAAHRVDAVYLGWAGDGHLGRLNLTHAFYQALGRDTANPIALRPVSINAQMAAAEASWNRDWLRFKGGFLFASGDNAPGDGTARGFDSIVDTPEFAGGRFSFWNAQSLRLTRRGVNMVGQNSLLPSMRTNKFAGQANFVNPGIVLVHGGVEGDVTQRLKLVANANYLRFHHSAPIAALLGTGPLGNEIGLDLGAGGRYRPFLNEHAVVEAGYSLLVPGGAIRRIYGGPAQTAAVLNAAFVRLRMVF